MIYEAEKYGSYRKAYLALLADSGLLEPTRGELKAINALLNNKSREEMAQIYEFAKTKFLWVTKVAIAEIVTPLGIEPVNTTTFSNGSVIITVA